LVSHIARAALGLQLMACSDTHVARREDAGTALPEAVLLTSVEPEPAGAACAAGGQRVRAGFDQNDDGVLQADEVRAATVVCQSYVEPDAASALDAGAAIEAGRTDAGTGPDVGLAPDADTAPDVGPAEHGCADKPVGRRTLDTDSAFDLAIAGEGFFVLRAPLLEPHIVVYTRIGRFHVDPDGYLVDRAGYRLQGYGVDAAGQQRLTLDDLRFSLAPLPAQATARTLFGANLDAAVTRAPAWDPSSPATTSNFSSSVVVYDSLGRGHQLTLYFAKESPQKWSWHACVDGSELNGGSPGRPVEGASGELAFTSDGALASERTTASSWSFLGALAAQAIVFDFGTSLEELGSGLEATTSFASPSTTNIVQQDGYSVGSLGTVDVDASGALHGVYTNRVERALGQLPLAAFLSPDALVCGGDDHWLASEQSGSALLGVAGSAGHGVLRARALEQR
jgi:flagellar hook protein FlgE